MVANYPYVVNKYILNQRAMKDKQVKEFTTQMKIKSDLLMNYFLSAFFIIGLLLAFYYDTWIIAIGVGGLSLTAYFSSKAAFPDSNLYQYVLSATLGIFMAQYIYQMHGMFEMHFFAFIGSAILITYRNWRLQIPLAIIVVIHHAVFGYLQFVGLDKIYFTQLEYMTIQTFSMHMLLSIVIFFICGLWAYNFKRSEDNHISQSFEIGKLQEANKQKDNLVAMSEDLKKSNNQLKEANDELGKIFNTVEEVLFSMDVINCRIIHISVACEKVYGYTSDEIIADKELWMKIIHPDDVHIIQDYFAELRQGKTVVDRYRIIHKDKSIHWVKTKLTPTLEENGLVIRIDGITNDITEKIKLQNKLNEEKKLKQQQITAAIITAQENERSFLGEELHDNINPILATVKLYIDCVIGDDNKRDDLLKDSKGFINTAMNEIRVLSKKLIPPSLGEIGLVGAITDMIENVKRVNDLKFIQKWEGIDESLIDDKMKLTIFRIVQEQFNNIFKHANAKTVFIELKQEAGMLEVNIKDDGIGFDVSQKRNGVGLQNIVSRTELFDGKALINSEPDKGCELSVRFNIQQRSIPMEKTLRA
jgi:PAS domain S-box-containing protein